MLLTPAETSTTTKASQMKFSAGNDQAAGHESMNLTLSNGRLHATTLTALGPVLSSPRAQTVRPIEMQKIQVARPYTDCFKVCVHDW